MKKKQRSLYLLTTYLLFPISFAWAAPSPSEPTTFAELAERIVEILNYLIPLLFAVAFIYMMWKVIDAWVINGGDQAKRQEGRQLLLVAVLMFVLMIVTWGIVVLLRNAFFGV